MRRRVMGEDEVKKFGKWLSKAIKTTLIFQRSGDNFIVVDGYTGFRIKPHADAYIREIKMQTFQDLDEDFQILDRKIKKESRDDLSEVFKCEKECIETNLYHAARGTKHKIFMVEDEVILLNEKYVENIITSRYKCYGAGKVLPVVFIGEYVDYVVLPIRSDAFGYKIEKITG